MATDVGSIVGIAVLMLFGLLIAFVLPVIIRRAEKKSENPTGNSQMILWLRILGIAVAAIGLLQIVLILILDRYGFKP